MRLSLRNRLVLVFSAVTFVAIGALYLYVAPGLQSNLINQKLNELMADSARYSGRVMQTVGSADPLPVLRARVDAASLASGDRVTLLLVNRTPSGPQLSAQADSGKLGATAPLKFSVAYRAVRDRARRRGTEKAKDGTVAEAANPVSFQGRVAAVIM